jgi:anti-sigma B factor antagonist
MTGPIRITERRHDDVLVLDLAGRLVAEEGDRPFAERVETLLRAGSNKVLVNLRDVSYIDSAGVGMLVAKFVTARRQGGCLKLMHLNDRTGRVLEIARLLTVFEVFDSEPEALASFRPAPDRTTP